MKSNPRNRSNIIGYIGATAFGLSLIGCNGTSDAPTASTAEPAAGNKMDGAKSTLKVALLTPGPVNDAGWNALAGSGLQAVKTATGAETENQQAEGGAIKDALRSYAQKGYNLVFGHGYEYNQPAMDVAKDFPNTVFMTSSGGGTAKNVGAFRFYLEQGFYLAGMMAAKMSKTGVIGEVGGDDVPSIESTFKAFTAGAKSVNPAIKVIKVYTGNGNDVAAAKKAAESEIAQKADFIIHQADDAAQGVFNACKEHNVYAFGANSDQNSNDSGIVIASASIKCDPAFVQVAKEVADKTFTGSVVLESMKEGAIEFEINPALQSKVPADVQKLILDTEAKIKSGALVVPKDNF